MNSSQHFQHPRRYNPSIVTFNKNSTSSSVQIKGSKLLLSFFFGFSPDCNIIITITLSETWLNKDNYDNEIELPGYSITRRDRRERTGGGVMIYIRENLVFNERNDLHNSNEAIWIQVNRTRCKPLIIGCVYRPPNQQVDKFLEDFNNSLAGIESHFDKIILGDFNIDYSSKRGSNANQSDRRKLKGIADLHDMKQIIDLPTRIAEHSESQIDLIFTDNNRKIFDFGVKDFGISDHSMVYCVFKSGLMKVPPKTLEYRSFKSYNKSAFRQDLKNVPWQVALNNPEDLEGCVQTWNKLFTQVAEDHAPTKTRRVRGTPTPWMTSENATLMRDRNYHLKKAKGYKTNFHWKQYRALRNKVQRKIKKSKSEYYCNLTKDSRNNPSDLWKSVKEAIPGSNPCKDNITSLISDGITHTNPTSMSSIFNKFFATIGVKLAEKFTMNRPTTNGVNQASSNFAFKTINCESVTKKIKELKPNKAVGLDKVSSRMLKVLLILLHQASHRYLTSL